MSRVFHVIVNSSPFLAVLHGTSFTGHAIWHMVIKDCLELRVWRVKLQSQRWWPAILKRIDILMFRIDRITFHYVVPEESYELNQFRARISWSSTAHCVVWLCHFLSWWLDRNRSLPTINKRPAPVIDCNLKNKTWKRARHQINLRGVIVTFSSFYSTVHVVWTSTGMKFAGCWTSTVKLEARERSERSTYLCQVWIMMAAACRFCRQYKVL